MPNVKNNQHVGDNNYYFQARGLQEGISMEMEALVNFLQNTDFETGSSFSAKSLSERQSTNISAVASEIPAQTEAVDNLPVEVKEPIIKPEKRRCEGTSVPEYHRFLDRTDDQSGSGNLQNRPITSEYKGSEVRANSKTSVGFRNCKVCIIQ